MYEQKENKSKAVANAVRQKKSNGKQGAGSVCNIRKAVTQWKQQGIANINFQEKSLMQSKGRSVNSVPSSRREVNLMNAQVDGEQRSVLFSAPVNLLSTNSSIIQRFKVPQGYAFPKGHTSQPDSLEFQKIGDTKKKHHIIPDSVLLKYLEEVNNKNDLKILVPWAKSAIKGEILRLQEADRKFEAWKEFDNWYYGLQDENSWDFDAMATEVTKFADSYNGLAQPLFVRELNIAAGFLNGLQALKSYPVDAVRKIEGWRDAKEFQDFFGIEDLKDLVRNQNIDAINAAVKTKLGAIVKAGNVQEYQLFDANERTMTRVAEKVKSLNILLEKVEKDQELNREEIGVLLPMLTWIPANIMIGAGDRRWEPGEDLDVEVLEKHPDDISRAILTNLSVLLKEHFTSQGKKLIDEYKGTLMSRRIITELEKEFGSNIPDLLKQLTESSGTGESTNLEPVGVGGIEKEEKAWGDKFRKAIDKASYGLDYDEHRYDDLYQGSWI